VPNDSGSGVLEIKDVQTLPSKFNENRVLSVAKCRPMIVVSRNVRYVQIFAGVPLAGAPNHSGVVYRQANNFWFSYFLVK